jgi:hypothetical protein
MYTDYQTKMAKLHADMEEATRKEKEIKEYEKKMATHTEPNLRFMEEWLEKSISSQSEWYIEGSGILTNPENVKRYLCTHNSIYTTQYQYQHQEKERQERDKKEKFKSFSTHNYIFMYHSHPKMSEFLEKIKDKKSILTNEHTKLYNEKGTWNRSTTPEEREQINEKIKNNRKLLDIINKEHQEITDKITKEMYEVRTFVELSSNSQIKFVQSVFNMFKIQQEKIDKLEKEIERIKTA